MQLKMVRPFISVLPQFCPVPRWLNLLARPVMLAVLLASTAIALSQPGPSPAGDYPSLKAEAEKYYAEGSYAKANEVYSRLLLLSSISHDDARWVAFRCADTQWRAAAGTDNPDTTKLDEARDNLVKQIRDLTREDQHDRVWVEVQESLGDFFWTRHGRNYGTTIGMARGRIIWRRSTGGPARATWTWRGNGI